VFNIVAPSNYHITCHENKSCLLVLYVLTGLQKLIPWKIIDGKLIQTMDVDNSNDDMNNGNVNDHTMGPLITVQNNELSESSYICNENAEEPIYHELCLDDYEEHVFYKNYGGLDFD